jgi:cardiolipin synthase
MVSRMNLTIPWVAAGSLLHVTAFLLVCLHCLQNRREEAASTLLWIFLAWSFPVLGPFLYVTLGVDRLTPRGAFKNTQNARFLAERQARENVLPLAYWHAVNAASIKATLESDPDIELNRAIDTLAPDYPLLAGNDITPLITGDETFPVMLSLIDQASHHIHLQSFIIRNDPTARAIFDRLAAKAREGVTVRVLYDRFGSTQATLSGFFRRYRRVPNMTIHGWTQVNPLKRRFQMNLRNHRKVLITDGRCACFGGINISADNTTRQNRPAIRDYHFRICGPVVQQLQYAFLQDWFFISRENPDNLLHEACFPSISHEGSAPARVINSGPTTYLQTIADVFFMAIAQARTQILIVTPYFVPTTDLLRALRCAALRGVEVRLILPQKNNHFYAGWASHAFYEGLLCAGVRIFHRHPPFLHAKAVLIDGYTAITGTANWDVRSLRLNYETSMIVCNETFAGTLKRLILEDEALSDEITLAPWRRRPPWHRLVENACSLLAPVL